MNGKVVLITGASSGIGKAMAIALAAKGADLVLLCRNHGRAAATVAEIQRVAPHCKTQILLADLRSQQQTRAAADQFLATGQPLHVLINNAGLILRRRSLTDDGHETTFAVNHLAHFLLTDLLLSRLRDSAPSRVINVASRMHKIGRMHFEDIHLANNYGLMRAYAQSKLANILFTRELSCRLAGSGVTANAATPGLVASGFGRNNPGLPRILLRSLSPFMRTPQQGAETFIYLSTSPDITTTTGAYFADCQAQEVSPRASNDDDARTLWRISEEMTDSPTM